MLSTVSRAGRLLDLFSAERCEWSTTAVAKELDVAKSQAHELLVSLADIGLLERVGPGRYQLGWRIVSLNSLLLVTSDLRREAARVMRALVARYGETVQLSAWGRGAAICIAACRGGRPAAVSPPPLGSGLPAHCTGPGKVLLASRPREEVDDVIGRDGLAPMTDRTIVSVDKLRKELAAVRRRGFAYDYAEYAPDTCCVAAPIVHADGDVAAAVSISAPAHRWRARRDDYTRAIVAGASDVSRLVSHRGAPGANGRAPGSRPAPVAPGAAARPCPGSQ
jgi:IclR family KDG regulon transcriptional repressor